MSEPRAGTIVRGACRLCDPRSCACPPRALLKKLLSPPASRAWNLDANTIFFLYLSQLQNRFVIGTRVLHVYFVTVCSVFRGRANVH